MTSVAVIGTGAMGSRIALRLAAAGHDVTVWNRTRAAATELAAQGCRTADSPRDATRDASVVVTVLSDPDALLAVADGADGIVAGLPETALWLEMSTVGPAAIRQLAERLPPGVDLLDAPMQGSIAEAEAGRLVLFVGGDEQVYERHVPLLRALGDPVRVGPTGAGAAAKLVANSALFGVVTLLGECLALGRGLGLDDDALLATMGRTALAEQAAKRWPSIAADDYPQRFALRLAAKDARLVLDNASAERSLPAIGASARWLREALARGLGERDYTAVLRVILDVAVRL